MLFAYRNFKRNKMVNLSATSIRHFVPDAKIYCVTFYENSPDEYNDQEPLLPFIEERKVKTKFPNTNGKPHDHPDVHATSGQGSPDTSKYFAEGYNEIWRWLRDKEDKVLMLGEDEFYTTGEVLKDFIDNQDKYWAAFGSWCWWGYEEKWANGTCVCFDLKALDSLFPLDENGPAYVEGLLYHTLCRIPRERRHIIEKRTFENYHGDGMRTNSSEKMAEELRKVGII